MQDAHRAGAEEERQWTAAACACQFVGCLNVVLAHEVVQEGQHALEGVLHGGDVGHVACGAVQVQEGGGGDVDGVLVRDGQVGTCRWA